MYNLIIHRQLQNVTREIIAYYIFSGSGYPQKIMLSSLKDDINSESKVAMESFVYQYKLVGMYGNPPTPFYTGGRFRLFRDNRNAEEGANVEDVWKVVV